MELRQLRYAVALADAGHFGRAAQELRIAQSRLSQQIKALERSLGTVLFDRDTRHVALTPPGRVFVEHARVVLELAGRAQESVRLLEKDKTGLIKVATNSAGLPRGMAELLHLYRGRHPSVEVELHPGFSAQNVEALRQRRVDLALVTLPIESAESPNFLHLGWIEVMVIVPEGHPLASFDRIPRDELIRQPFLTVPRSANPPAVDRVHDLLFEDREPRPLVESIDMAVAARISKIARDGGSVGVGFGYEAELEATGVVFRHVEEPMPRLEYGLIWFDIHASPLLEPFLAVAREVVDLRLGDRSEK
jgi:DNA-binding transcriptional LysR family regulator